MALEEKQAARLKVLKAFYEISDGDEWVLIDRDEIAKHTGLDPEQVEAARMWLVHEKLVITRALSGVSSISHLGVREIEAAQAHPGAPTKHFLPTVTQYVFNGPVGAVQTGAQSTANVTQSVGFNAAEVTTLIAELRAVLPRDRDDLHETVADLEAEASASQPKQSRIRSSLAFLWTASKDIATVAPFVLQLAKIFGVQIPGM